MLLTFTFDPLLFFWFSAKTAPSILYTHALSCLSQTINICRSAPQYMAACRISLNGVSNKTAAAHHHLGILMSCTSRWGVAGSLHGPVYIKLHQPLLRQTVTPNTRRCVPSTLSPHQQNHPHARCTWNIFHNTRLPIVWFAHSLVRYIKRLYQ